MRGSRKWRVHTLELLDYEMAMTKHHRGAHAAVPAGLPRNPSLLHCQLPTLPPSSKPDANVRCHILQTLKYKERSVPWKVNRMIVLRLDHPLQLSTSSNYWSCDFSGLGCDLGLGIFKSTPLSPYRRKVWENHPRGQLFSAVPKSVILYSSLPLTFPAFSMESKKAYTLYYFYRHAEQI